MCFSPPPLILFCLIWKFKNKSGSTIGHFFSVRTYLSRPEITKVVDVGSTTLTFLFKGDKLGTDHAYSGRYQRIWVINRSTSFIMEVRSSVVFSIPEENKYSKVKCFLFFILFILNLDKILTVNRIPFKLV